VGTVIDTSAVVAVLLAAPGSDALVRHLDEPGPRLMSAATRVELGIVMEARLGRAGTDAVDRLLQDADVEVVPFDIDAADRALSAWRRFGKGRHRAALNLGDCYTYALADQTGFPVLCTGDDFASTDLTVVRPPASP
jgi:ribonuclease VapC